MASNLATASQIYDSNGNLIDNPALNQSGTITAQSLEPVSGLPYVNPNPTVTPSIPDLTPAPMTATPQESEADSLTKRLQDLNLSLTGESAARTTAEQAQGISGLTQTQTDLSNRLKALQVESLQIPLQLQQQAEGRGITAGGLQPLQTSALRENAIKSLSISSLLEASRNNLATAQSLADKAVESQFAPLKAERDAKMANLELLLKSPGFTLAEKNRANAQLQTQKKQQAQEDRQKEEAKAGQALINAAMKNSGGSQDALMAINQALKLDATKTADYTQRVFDLVGKFQTNPLEVQNQILQNRKLQRDLEVKQTAEDQLYSGLSTPTSTAVRARVAKFATEPTIQNFATIQDGRNFAASIPDKTTNPADDQALIYSLAKALDPGSVVREGEYATAQKYSQSWINAYGKGVEQALLGTGFLSEVARKNIKKTIEQKFNASKKSYDNLLGQYTKGINNLTGRADGNNFLTDYTIPEEAVTTPTEDIQVVNGITYKKGADGLYYPVQ